MSTILGRGKFLQLVREGKWEFVDRVNAKGVVAVVAVTADRRILLTEQYRPAVGRSVIDVPAGLAGDVPGQENEELQASALRELIEETGYVASELHHVANCPSSPGLTSEVVSMFLARDLQRKSSGGGVEGENITVHTPFLRSIERWLATQSAAGKLIDGKVYAGLYFARGRAGGSKVKPGRKS